MTSHIPSEPVALTVARAVNALDVDTIPSNVTSRASMLVLDAVGAALAAAQRKHCDGLIDALAQLTPGGDQPAIGTGRRLSPRDAACANGMLMHSLEFDDTHMTAILHVTSVLFPAALSIGLHLNASGRDILTAYIAGAEILARLGIAAEGGYQRRGFHPTGVLGAFAAAVTAGKLLHLDDEKVAHAQGIALSLAGGSMQFLQGGGDMKRFHPGWAAHSGITAAMMAAKGVKGPAHSYEGRHGLFKSYLGVDMPAGFTARLADIGSDWEVPVVSVKPFPAAYYTHACIECAIDLGNYDRYDPADIETVIARVPSQVVEKIGEPLQRKRNPASFSEVQFALPYVVAAAFVRHRFTLEELADDVRNDAEIIALSNRTICEGMDDTDYPRFYPGAIELVFRNGNTLKKNITENLGSPARPIGDDLIVDKFCANASGFDADKIRTEVLRLHTAVDGSSLAEALAGEPVYPAQ